MGYCTAYNLDLLTVDGESILKDSVVQDGVVELLREMGVIGYALNDVLMCHDNVRWYSHEDDMLEVSKQFPNVLFCLHGQGDDSEDIWDEYFLNGKSQYCRAEITIPPFDPAKLQ